MIEYTNKAISELVEAYHAWLSSFPWRWFGTLTFRGYPSAAKAKHNFNKWIGEVNDKYGTDDFRWFCVTERGANGNNIHFHVLIGGLCPSAGARQLSIIRWEELAGSCQISSFIPNQDGIYYIVKTLRPGREFDVDFLLAPATKVVPERDQPTPPKPNQKGRSKR